MLINTLIHDILAYSFRIAPPQFMKFHDQTCSNMKTNSFGCHCIESNVKCREILLYLKKSGRFQSLAIANILYQELQLSFGSTFAESLDDMIEDIIYPAFMRKFQHRQITTGLQIKNFSSGTERLETFKDCIANGPDCSVALNSMNDLLSKSFRIFNVMSNDLRLAVNSSLIIIERQMGTLLANLNFLLEVEHENDKEWPTIAFSRLQSDLRKLGRLIYPTQTMTIPEVAQLLGFTQRLGTHGNNMGFSDLDLDFLNKNKDACNVAQFQNEWGKYLNKIFDLLKGTYQ